jgi:hypothetical protein
MNEIGCPNCGSLDVTITKMFSGPHEARCGCNDCKRFIKWMPKAGLNHKKRCKEQLSRATTQQPYNKYYKSLQEYFDEHGTLTPNQLKSIEKF